MQVDDSCRELSSLVGKSSDGAQLLAGQPSSSMDPEGQPCQHPTASSSEGSGASTGFKRDVEVAVTPVQQRQGPQDPDWLANVPWNEWWLAMLTEPAHGADERAGAGLRQGCKCGA